MRIPDDRARELFKLTMEEKGHTLRSLATEVGCGHSMINALRRDPRKTCSTDLAQRIALALDVPVEALFLASVSGKTVQGKRTGRAA